MLEVVRQMAYCNASKKNCIHLHHSEFVRVASFLINITVIIPCKILNLLVKTTEENSVLSVFSCHNFLKISKETTPINKYNSILPENLALHPKHVQMITNMPPIFHLEKLIKASYKKKNFKKEKATKGMIVILKNRNHIVKK